MKKLLLIAAVLVAGASLLRADDVALVTFKYDGKAHQAVFEFYEGDAPLTVENFKKLARKGFYNGLTIHRAFPHILVQTGDPLSAHKDRSKVGTGGPGYTLPPEIHRKNIAGAIAAARLPDKINLTRLSNGSQFYICLKPMPSYDGQYTVFGQVISGMDTLDEISAKPVDSNDNPIDRIVVSSVKIMPREKLPKLAGGPVPPPPAFVKPAPVKPAPPAPAPAKPALAKYVPPTPTPAKSALAKHAPVTPPPVTPAPAPARHWWQLGKPAASPAPVTPAPTKLALVKPAPPTPVPAKLALAKHAPVTPPPATPAPPPARHWWQIGKPAASPAPVTPAPTKLALVKPAPPTPVPAKLALAKHAPETPPPATPAPVATRHWWQIGKPAASPAPATPAAVTPAPIKPALAKPATPKPTPAKPASGKAKPATPAPATPAPAKPKPWWQIF